MFHFNKNEIWTPQKAASLMTCLHRKRQFLFNGDYQREEIKLLRVHGLGIMGRKLLRVCKSGMATHVDSSVHTSEQKWMFCYADLCARACLHICKCLCALQMCNGTREARRCAWCATMHLERHVEMGTHTCSHSQRGHCTSVHRPMHVAARTEMQKHARNAQGQMQTRMGHTHANLHMQQGQHTRGHRAKSIPAVPQTLHPTPGRILSSHFRV